MDALYQPVLIGSALVLAALFSSLLAFRVGAPLLLVFLGLGLLTGEDGLGLEFDNAPLAYFVGSLALAIILFDSGFGTRLRSVRFAVGPAVVLASAGVVLTAGLVGIAAHFFFGLGLMESLLLGAIVSSTDAAAVFFLLRVGGTVIRDRVRSTLEIESGSNDPMAIFLTVTLISALAAHSDALELGIAFLTSFVTQMGLGLALGLAGGYGMVRVINQISVEAALYPLIALALAIALFALTGYVGGSGFLAVYVAGLYAGNSRLRRIGRVREFQDGITWLSQITMFLVLGLLATPSQFPVVAVPAIATSLVLIFLARPIAVGLCLLPFGYNRNEIAFIAWVGLRGAVSILLAILPLMSGLANAQLLFNAAFIVVLSSLLIQGWTIRPMARRLNLVVPPGIGPVEKFELELPGAAHHELVAYRVAADSPIVSGERLPRWARPSLIIRDGQSMRYQYAGAIRAGDLVYLFAAPRYVRLLDRLFASPAALAADDGDFFGAFTIDPGHTMGELVATYNLAVPRADPEETIAHYMLSRLGGTAEIGDRVHCGSVDLIVRDTDTNAAIAAVGLALEPVEPSLLRGAVAELSNALRQRVAGLFRR